MKIAKNKPNNAVIAKEARLKQSLTINAFFGYGLLRCATNDEIIHFTHIHLSKYTPLVVILCEQQRAESPKSI
ncbi:MAG: hypothetical protein LBG80_15235, partial [Bacteroidales bacterium]|nr:hypothetical protein [Bacteroidales bacterium]